MKKLIAAIISFSPALAMAQTAPITDVNSLTYKLIGIGNVILYLLIAAAVIFIVWNIVMVLIKGSDPEAKSGAWKNVGWGVVGLAIILSIWGLVNILTNTFRTTPTYQAIPNIGNNVSNGGIPANQMPVVQ
ncbi:hypothetical protein KGQ27_01975 [Patescibacteria group bacterium]|nr:hypothetical protein [Patescibacteria group bacterium]MDE1946314.1 hypothetical protein [Patescibacteria group bacterium]MDE2010766.1 hypothetical protein [Patescibacteria group bacterium]MDE2232651.1 hypothetical protein [Patescibacteria group bacterium]